MLLIDIDAATKLAHWDLLDELPLLTGIPWDKTATLSSLGHRARRCLDAPDGRLFRTSTAASSVLSAVQKMADLPSATEARLAIFQDSADIDPGEAVLLAIVPEHPDLRLLTGDKRALRALSHMDGSSVSGYFGRVHVIEQVLLAALAAHNIEWLRTRVCRDTNIDKAIGICMGSRCDASADSVTAGLQSYIDEIGLLTNPTLLAHM